MTSLNPDFTAALQKRFRGELRSDLATRILYSTDASIYQIEPLGVAFPKTQEDLHIAVELAAEYKIPILPRGSGSSLAGQAIGEALILDCSRWLDKLVEIDPESRTATVEPGLVLSRLNAAAAKHGLTFGPDPASAERATMGGVIANNATGAHSILYGMSADHLISADVVMADGSLGILGERSTLDNPLISDLHSSALEIRENHADAILKFWPTTWRNSAGYRLNYLLPWSPSKPSQWYGEYPAINPTHLNLVPLLAGSEGTLAIIRRAKVNLVPKPKHTILSVLSYRSNAEACEDVPRLLMHHPSAVELVPQMILRLARGVPEYARQMGWVVGDPAALLVVEFSGDQPLALKEAARKIGDILTIAESKEDQERIWNIRKVGLGLLDSRPQSERPVAFIEDCAIPVQKLGDFVREVEKILSAHGTEGGIYAHASAGCLHIRPILNLKTARGVRDLREISEAVFALTLRLGGAMSSEHGDGLARTEYLEQTYGVELMDAMRALKRAADPNNLLNPGKIIDAQKMDVNLRFGVDYQTRVWNTNLSFARNGGLAVAIEQCNGQGVCRKDTGVMCPSFQATREEMHSTRGRANLLRALVMSPSPFGRGVRGEGESAAFGALDLCLACKGCKAECPSGVDMAKLKYEFQHEYYKSHRRSLRDYLFAYIGPLAQIGAPFAGLVNFVMGQKFIRKIVNPVFKLAEERELPKFNVIAAPRTSSPKENDNETVLLLRDTFTHFFEPEIEQAVLAVLAACGIRVKVLPYFGAGRTLISKGFIEPARRHAIRILEAVRKLDPGGRLPVLGIEPSELYTLRDEFFDLLPERRAEVESLAARAWLVEEFLVRPVQDDKNQKLRITNILQGNLNQKTQKISLHGHCYQKAQPPVADGFPVGQSASAELLRAVGYEVEVIPSGCCGMAGAFGYEAEHYNLSMQVGELVLLPAVRQARENGRRIAAVGTSCRSQIADGAKVQAQHPILLVADRIHS